MNQPRAIGLASDDGQRLAGAGDIAFRKSDETPAKIAVRLCLDDVEALFAAASGGSDTVQRLDRRARPRGRGIG